MINVKYHLFFPYSVMSPQKGVSPLPIWQYREWPTRNLDGLFLLFCLHSPHFTLDVSYVKPGDLAFSNTPAVLELWDGLSQPAAFFISAWLELPSPLDFFSFLSWFSNISEVCFFLLPPPALFHLSFSHPSPLLAHCHFAFVITNE